MSHSSHDIEKVRMIRNEFEKMGHSPLAFHLKCLNDNTEDGKKEIFELLKREIDARNWFVFCDSQEAKSSEYVQYEQAYIINSGKKYVWPINLNESNERIIEHVRRISAGVTVTISYDYRDKDIAERFKEFLRLYDYTVLFLEDVPEGEEFDGFFIHIITKHNISNLASVISYYECHVGINAAFIIISISEGVDIGDLFVNNMVYIEMGEKQSEADMNLLLQYLDDNRCLFGRE